jgi:multimeric flavodoxin WrbA
MKVLGISGSPRKGGNTDTLLDVALEGAAAQGAKIEKVFLEDLDISPCREQEYENINDEGFSVVDDDMRVIYRKIGETDVLIVASPIFFGSLSAQTKTMIDRFQCVWLAKNVFKKKVFSGEKKGGLICVGGAQRKDFFDNARSIVRNFFATIGVDYAEELFCPGIEKKGGVLEYPEFLDAAHELGRKLSG